MQARRRRSAAVPLALTAILASASLAGCGSSEDDADGTAVCVEEGTQERVDDDRCDDDRDGYYGGFGWYFFPIGTSYPAVGSKVSGGSTAKPSTGKFVKGGAPTTGGKSTSVTKGGFGSKSSGTSVGG